MASANGTAASMATGVPKPFLLLHLPADPSYRDAYVSRSCLGTLCVACPVARSLFGQSYVDALLRLGNAAIAVIVCSLLMLVLLFRRPQFVINRTIHTTALTMTYVLYGVAFLFSMTESQYRRSACYDDITANHGRRDPRCAASGFLFVYGLMSSRIWNLLWALDTQLQVVWFRSIGRAWVRILVGVSIPLALALAAIPWQQFVLGPFCMPEPGKPLRYIIQVPYAAIDLASCVIQLGTLAGIVYRLSRIVRPDADSERTFVSRSAILAAPIVKALKLFWRPLVLVLLNTLGTLLVIVGLYGIEMPDVRSGLVAPAHLDILRQWFGCVGADQRDTDVCSDVIAQILDFKLYVNTWYYTPLAFAIAMDLLLVRWDAVWAALREWRQRRRLSSTSTNISMDVDGRVLDYAGGTPLRRVHVVNGKTVDKAEGGKSGTVVELATVDIDLSERQQQQSKAPLARIVELDNDDPAAARAQSHAANSSSDRPEPVIYIDDPQSPSATTTTTTDWLAATPVQARSRLSSPQSTPCIDAGHVRQPRPVRMRSHDLELELPMHGFAPRSPSPLPPPTGALPALPLPTPTPTRFDNESTMPAVAHDPRGSPEDPAPR